jgi:peptidoglycan/LPS O-acetylase OafA/YrhL
VGLCVATIAVSVVARGAGFHPWLLLARGDGLALGALIAVLTVGRTWTPGLSRALMATALVGLLILAGGCGVVGCSFLAEHMGYHAGGSPAATSLVVLAFSLVYAGLVGLVVGHVGRPGLAVLRVGALRYLGQISYGLYFYHAIVYHIVVSSQMRLGLPRACLTPLCLLGSLGLAVASWHLVERPILRLKDRLPYGEAAGGDRLKSSGDEGR